MAGLLLSLLQAGARGPVVACARLTAAPDPVTVRPEGVLRAAYERLVRLLRAGEQGYYYALDQFKGMRQDITVQRLRNDLAARAPSDPGHALFGHGFCPAAASCKAS